jgi:endonuclease/exonuclease/phosphatase family metal-dependent hydrolase
MRMQVGAALGRVVGALPGAGAAGAAVPAQAATRRLGWAPLLLLGGAAIAGALLLAGCARRSPQPPTPQPDPTPPGGGGPTPDPGPTTPGTTTTPPPAAAAHAVTIGQLNAWNLFDTVDQPRVQDEVLTPAAYELRLNKLALAIRDAMGAPDVIAMQEVENEQVLRDLAARPELRELGYVPLIVEGSDPRGIDVAYLYRPDRLELLHHEQRRTTYVSPTGRNIQLFTRPPLVATFRARAGASDAQAGAAFTLIDNHFTSQLQGDDGARKRLLQAAYVSSLADGSAGVELLDPTRTIVLGDLNEGLGDPAYQELVTGPGETPALINAADHLPVADRYSWRDGTHRQLLDHVLLAPALDARIGTVSIPHINSDPSEREADVPGTYLRSSDHDPVVVSVTP